MIPILWIALCLPVAGSPRMFHGLEVATVASCAYVPVKLRTVALRCLLLGLFWASGLLVHVTNFVMVSRSSGVRVVALPHGPRKPCWFFKRRWADLVLVSSWRLSSGRLSHQDVGVRSGPPAGFFWVSGVLAPVL